MADTEFQPPSESEVVRLREVAAAARVVFAAKGMRGTLDAMKKLGAQLQALDDLIGPPTKSETNPHF